LYRHSLELYLKAVVYKGAALLGLTGASEIDTRKLFTGHELTRFLGHVRAI